MADIFEIPLSGMPQHFRITLGDTSYYFTLVYRWAFNGGWVLDINDADDAPLICGIPLVTGANLLAQYEYLGFGQDVALVVDSDGNPDDVPTFNGLGTSSRLLWLSGLLAA